MNKIFAVLLVASASFSAVAQTQTIRCFSHRGGRMEHDENTLSAFEASRAAGFNGYETDIRMTADGALVVTHDSSLDRTTNGHGNVEQKTLAEILALDTRGGHKMLTLDELLKFLEGGENLYVEFEMKTTPAEFYPDDRLAEYVDMLYAKVMANKPADALYLFTSSDMRALQCMQQRHPDAELLLITGDCVNDATIAQCKSMNIPRLGARMNGTSRAAVQKAHAEGLVVSLWPGESVADFMLGAYLGADYMCTDRPVEVKSWVTTHAPYLQVVY